MCAFQKNRARRLLKPAICCVLVSLCITMDMRITQGKAIPAAMQPALWESTAKTADNSGELTGEAPEEWVYSETYARQFPGIVTYESGDSIVSFAAYSVPVSAQRAITLLKKQIESALQCELTPHSLGKNQTEIQCFAAKIDVADVYIFVRVTQTALGESEVKWAQAYAAQTQAPLQEYEKLTAFVLAQLTK